jgi:membrane dipeptidase
MLGLVHSSSNNLADSGGDVARWHGLSPLGARAIDEANTLGLWVDLSHASEAAILAAARQTRAPLIASHTAAAALVPDNPANLSDTAIRAIADSGGLVCVFFGSEALLRGYLPQARETKRAVVAELQARGIDLSSQEAEAFAATEFDRRLPRATVGDVADHVAHVVRIAGTQHACLGSDFDGIGPTAARGLEDVAHYPALFEELRKRGLDEDAIEAIAGGNLVRTWRAVQALAGGGSDADR